MLKDKFKFMHYRDKDTVFYTKKINDTDIIVSWYEDFKIKEVDYTIAEAQRYVEQGIWLLVD
jgi:hypothetical protein